MSRPRVLIPEQPRPEVGRELLLEGAPAHHLVRVLRVRDGDALQLFDGSGAEWDARVVATQGPRLVVAVVSEQHPEREAPFPLTLIQGLCRGERMDHVMQKATELGASRIVALRSQRSNVRLDAARASKRLKHWQGVVASACEQCGRVRVPPVEGLLDLDEACAIEAQLRLVLDPTATRSLSELLSPDELPGSLALMVGPEGGFDEAELAQLRAAGWEGVVLGPRVLRTETAGAAALAAIQGKLGLF